MTGMSDSWLCQSGDDIPTGVGVYLCEVCLAEAEAHLAMIPGLLPVLDAIGRGEEKAFTLPAAEGRGSDPYRAPVNLAAIELQGQLRRLRSWTKHALRREPNAAAVRKEILHAVNKADVMVNGRDEDKPTEDYVLYRLSQLEPLPAKEAAATLSECLGIDIRSRQVYKWRDRGRLIAVEEKLRGDYDPEDLAGMEEQGHPLPPAAPRYRLLDVYRAWINRGRPSWSPPVSKHTPPRGVTYTQPMP